MNNAPVTNECLTSDQLAQILASETGVSCEVQVHLETCDDCQRRLEAMIDSDFLSPWSAVANSTRFQKLYFGSDDEKSLPAASFGNYKLECLIGSGGMGSVYRAHDQRLDRTVAVKVLKHFDNPDSQLRFEREARSLSQIDHPHIVPVFVSDRTDDGRPYLVMPYIEGKTLREVLKSEMLDSRRAAEVILQVSLGLHAAHETGLIHRDVKATNIIIENQNGLAKLVDFGLARMPDQETLTDSHVICGTPEYMSPEQTGNSHRMDSRSDQYSLGITLYECLTGTTPFRGRPLDVLKQHNEVDPVPPSRLNQAVPRDLETICLKALSKDPAERYSSLAQFSDDLSSYLKGLPIAARPVGSFGKLRRWAFRNRALAATLFMLFLAMLVGTMTSTSFWLRSEKSAAEANQKNADLQASQKRLRDNHDVLRRSLQNSFRDTMRDEEAFVQLPTAVRNTTLIAFVQTSQLLFEASQHDANALREIASELSDAADFALTYQMELRAVELTHLGRTVIERLFAIAPDRSADDHLLAAKGLNLYAQSRLMLIELGARDPALAQSAEEASILAQDYATQAEEHFRAAKQIVSTELANLELFKARHNLVLAHNNHVVGDATGRTAELEKLVDAIRVTKQSEDVAIAWAKLQEELFFELAQFASPSTAIDYLNLRAEQFNRMQQLQTESDGKVDSWTIRSIAKNDAMIGRQYAQLAELDQARESYAAASLQFQGLCELYPLSGYYRISWFESLFLIANLDWEEGRCESALDYYDKALTQIELLSQLNPQDENVARRAAELHREIGSRYRENEQPELAAKMFREGAACAQRAANNPYRMDRDPAFYNELAQQLLQLAADAEKDILL